MSEDIIAAKRTLRRTMVARRDAIDLAERASAAAMLAAQVMARLAFPVDACIAGYFPFRSEFDVLPLLRVLHETGRALALPVVTGRGQKLLFRRYRPGDPMTMNALGIPEPAATAATVAPSHLLMPLLAFDDLGYRLGYGGGYYDRTLTALREAGHRPATIGIGFEAQRVAEVPRALGDQSLELVATERGFHGPLAGRM